LLSRRNADYSTRPRVEKAVIFEENIFSDSPLRSARSARNIKNALGRLPRRLAAAVSFSLSLSFSLLPPLQEKLLHFRRVPTSATIMGIDPRRSPLGTKFADGKSNLFPTPPWLPGQQNLHNHCTEVVPARTRDSCSALIVISPRSNDIETISKFTPLAHATRSQISNHADERWTNAPVRRFRHHGLYPKNH